LAVLLLAAGAAVSAQTFATRGTVAIKYPERETTSVELIGTSLNPRVEGKAEVRRTEGRTRIKLKVERLDHPQALGSFYTTYVLWAIAPEGQADNLGELLVVAGGEREIDVTTPHQTFGLILTAEPYGNVRLPSPAVVAENALRKHTKGMITASQIEYRGDPGVFYVVGPEGVGAVRGRAEVAPDYSTPLLVLGARRAVSIARRAGAEEYADSELRQAEVKLEALESIWPRTNEKVFSGEARDVMRLAERARGLAVERREQARLDAERRAANRTIADARSDAEQARDAAERATAQASRYRLALEQTETELTAARSRLAQAQSEAERARANEEVARLQAERARLASEQAKRERDEARKQLFVSISEILEARNEARGLIVSLSDVLFDFNKASLKPGAREKLSKLAGILLAYPAAYRMEIEGHTDSIGSDEYNLRLSEARAGSVREYLVGAGIPADRIMAVKGLGKTMPVATNDKPEGRQMNRRVEIIIADVDNN
jgi:outer membrane protein OmpA-like peptidoglycan-associated protein